jgi:hypothetical protein
VTRLERHARGKRSSLSGLLIGDKAKKVLKTVQQKVKVYSGLYVNEASDIDDDNADDAEELVILDSFSRK